VVNASELGWRGRGAPEASAFSGIDFGRLGEVTPSAKLPRKKTRDTGVGQKLRGIAGLRKPI
jgi:hypothetical protein